MTSQIILEDTWVSVYIYNDRNSKFRQFLYTSLNTDESSFPIKSMGSRMNDCTRHIIKKIL